MASTEKAGAENFSDAALTAARAPSVVRGSAKPEDWGDFLFPSRRIVDDGARPRNKHLSREFVTTVSQCNFVRRRACKRKRFWILDLTGRQRARLRSSINDCGRDRRD
jgi:hypothetical protein